MIGHAMPAAGAAGLIKAALALYHGVLPPTLHCDEPNPSVASTRFRLVTEAEPWHGERRAGVNAFGFGGINDHVVVDAPSSSRPRVARRPKREEELVLLAAESKPALLTALASGTATPGEGPWRLAVADPTRERLERAATVVETGRPRRGRDGIYFSSEGLLTGGGKIAFLFPGMEAEFDPQVADVAQEFGLAPLEDLSPDELERRGAGVIGVGRLLNAALGELGVSPDAVAGHSLGEWCGMIASGILDDAEVDSFIRTLKPGSLKLSGFVFAALGCGADRAQIAVGGLRDVSVTHDNCPHQSVICGPAEQVAIAVERLRAERVIGGILEYPRGGFHHLAVRRLHGDVPQPPRGLAGSLALDPLLVGDHVCAVPVGSGVDS